MSIHGPAIQKVRYMAVIESLVDSPNIVSASKKCGVGTSTIYRYLRDKDFNDQYTAFRAELNNTLVSRLAKHSHLAIDTLVEVMNNPQAKESNRVNASKAILDTALRAHEAATITVIQERLNSLEGSR